MKRVKETKACVKVVSLWAILIARVYEVTPLTCSNCGAQMKIVAFIKEQWVINKILDHIGEPIEAPKLSLARGPPDKEGYEQMDLLDEVTVELPDFEMDQTVAW